MLQGANSGFFRFGLAAIEIAGLCVASPLLARADAVTNVDLSLLATIRTEAVSPPATSRDIAMVGIAMYDAVNATTGLSYKPYAYRGSAITGLSPDAAAYAAGYTMLSDLFPALSSGFASDQASALAGLGLSPAEQHASVSFGSNIAASFYTARASDGSASAQKHYVPGTQPGNYQFTAPGQTTVVLPGWGRVRPFGITSVASVPPPALWGRGTPYADEAAYLASFRFKSDLATTEAVGCRTCGQTADELALSAFWADTNGNAKFGSTATPPGHWLDIIDTVAQGAGLTLMQTARLTAMVGTALADAGIVAWDVKNTYDFWRPDTAIHFYGNASWTPLWPDPLFQSYISGHSTFSMAAAATLADFFGTDDMSFCSTADPNGHDANNQAISTTPYASPRPESYTDPYGHIYTVKVLSPAERCYSSFSAAAWDSAGLSVESTSRPTTSMGSQPERRWQRRLWRTSFTGCPSRAVWYRW
jgi:hypothetical protein